jgi:hypothetical protein
MPSVLEELQSAGPMESTLPKTLTNNQIDDLIFAIDGYFFFNYNEYSFYDKNQIEEIKLFLDLRREVLTKYNELSKTSN